MNTLQGLENKKANLVIVETSDELLMPYNLNCHDA